MSRCFPYPPLGYVRNPVAVAVAEAETTAKLQKEREKAEKKERRSNRKGLQQGEKSKHSKHSHKKRKHEDIGTVGQEPKTLSKDSVEQLEKSGLSEEHGAPCFIQTVHHSPESSQDSSKRRKVVLPSPSQAKSGNIVRIKIKRDQDSPRGVLEKPMVLEQPSVKQGLVSSHHLSKSNSLQQKQPSVKQGLVSSHHLSKSNSLQQKNKVNVKSAAAAHQRIDVEPQAIQKQACTQHPSKFMGRDDPQMAKVVQQIDSKLSVKPPVGRADLQPARIDIPLVKVAQRDLPGNATPAKVFQKVDTQVSNSEIQRCPPACRKFLQEASTTAFRQLENLQPLQNSKLGAPVVNQMQRPISSVSKEEPSSCSNADAVRGQQVKQSKSDRKKSRKAEKKEKKFQDMFVTWNPPSFEMENLDVGVQDWLFDSPRNSDASMTNCRASDGSAPFQLMEQQPSLQPSATFFYLPYVVPF